MVVILIAIGVVFLMTGLGIGLGKLILTLARGVGMVETDEDFDDHGTALSHGPAVELAAPVVARQAARIAGARHPALASDLATADRHARLRAFQQREATIRAARRWM